MSEVLEATIICVSYRTFLGVVSEGFISIDMAKTQFEIDECDEAGNLTATYVQTATDQDGISRVDVILPEVAKSIWQRLLDVFLPAGYPHSVTDDYMEYQIYDSLQAFSSSIAGLLSSRAVLLSVGVGDSSASPTAALLLSIFQASAGRIATILFAHRFGTMLEPECKMYRLLADVLNDVAFILDCLSPMFPKAVRVIVLSLSSVLRALCGVAAGSAKASLSAHFARWGNLGELNAKDSSQETVISLLGMLAGSLVVPMVTTPVANWTTLIILLAIHLETNRRAVRAVSMKTLNRQRATLVYNHLLRGHVLTPHDISKEERIFERDGVLRDSNGKCRGHCTIGVSFDELLRTVAPQDGKTNSAILSANLLPKLLDFYHDQGYVLWYTTVGALVKVQVVIKKSASSKDLLTAWWQAITLANNVAVEKSASNVHPSKGMADRSQLQLEDLMKAMEPASKILETYHEALTKAGWDLDAGALETSTNSRLILRE